MGGLGIEDDGFGLEKWHKSLRAAFAPNARLLEPAERNGEIGAKRITVVEREQQFVTCPFSNGVLGGLWPLSRVTFDYQKMRAAGVGVIHDTASLAKLLIAQQKDIAIVTGASRIEISIFAPIIKTAYPVITG
jgi:hypothetical protein